MNKLLLGSNGYTGSLVKSLMPEIDSYSRAADGPLDDFLRADRFLKADMIINCIGPYEFTGNLILDALKNMNKVYLDITGEMQFVKKSFEKYADAKATIIHSCSFESFLADAMAKKYLDPKQEYEEINTYYKFENSRPSPGTRATAKLFSFLNKEIVQDGKYTALESSKYKKEFNNTETALMAPYPEIIFFKNRYKVKNIGSYIRMSKGEADFASLKESNDKDSLEKLKEKLQKSKYCGPGEEERKKQYFELILEADEERYSLCGHDMYMLSAQIIKLFSDKCTNEKSGVYAPSDFDFSLEIFEKLNL